MKLVGRGETTVVDAYLSPILRRYVDGVATQLGDVRLRFMQSHGGLTDARLFRGIPWSTGSVLRETASRCRAAGKPFSFLPPERDVDTFRDLLALRKRTASHPAPRCPRTREFLSSFFPVEGSGPRPRE
jgi:hypothetical protein